MHSWNTRADPLDPDPVDSMLRLVRKQSGKLSIAIRSRYKGKGSAPNREKDEANLGIFPETEFQRQVFHSLGRLEGEVQRRREDSASLARSMARVAGTSMGIYRTYTVVGEVGRRRQGGFRRGVGGLPASL